MRRLSSWVDAFVDYTDKLPSPLLFRKWGAIAAVAGVMERKVWVRSMDNDLYPNMYVVLVGPPGVGKSVVTSRVERLWGGIEKLRVASADVTAASLIDELFASDRHEVYPDFVPSIVNFHSLQIVSNELGSLIPAYENSLMNVLTNIWDGHPYAQKRRTRDIEIKMDRPLLHMLAGTTPHYLHDVMPEGAWDMGFISRVMLIYSGEVILRPPFDERSVQGADDLLHDLKIIHKLYGKAKFTPEAAAALTSWHMGGRHPRPDHPRLLNYEIRRTAQLLKLCIVACVSDSNELTITVDHYATALSWLLEAEHYMPDLFKSLRTGGDSKVIEEVWHFVYQVWMREKKPIVSARLVNFVSERTPAHNIERIISVMVKAGLLDQTLEKVGTCYTPKARTT